MGEKTKNATQQTQTSSHVTMETPSHFKPIFFSSWDFFLYKKWRKMILWVWRRVSRGLGHIHYEFILVSVRANFRLSRSQLKRKWGIEHPKKLAHISKWNEEWSLVTNPFKKIENRVRLDLIVTRWGRVNSNLTRLLPASLFHISWQYIITNKKYIHTAVLVPAIPYADEGTYDSCSNDAKQTQL